MLSEHDFLSPDECSRARNIIYGLKEHWVSRGHGLLPFYTLGAASYLDADKENQEPYIQAAQNLNPILKNHFPMLYERLTERLTEILKLPVVYSNEYAVPGFHIFLANKGFENPIASVHYDVQFQSLTWNYETVDFNHPISFTCPISLPKGGAGLNYWEISHDEAKMLSKSDLEALKETKGMKFLPYTLGNLILHQGLILHQIAPSKNIWPNDERITLQGHGIICDGIMRLYW